MLKTSKLIAAVLLILVALILSPGYPATAESQTAVLYSQAPSPTGGLLQSSWWYPDESNYDKYLWDNFTLDQTQKITEIQWRGGYDPALGGVGTVVDFKVAIYASNGAEPAYVSAPLVKYQTGGSAGETFAETLGGVNTYNYAFTLPAAFQAQGGTKYWVNIVAEQEGKPAWGLSKGTGGDGQHFRVTHDGSIPSFRTGDLAFTLLGPAPPPPEPISGLSATNDSPTDLGQPTAFSATVTGGSDVSYVWDFGDQTNGSGAMASHTYAAPGTYTAVVTASNSLGSVDATTEVTIIAPPPPSYLLYLPVVLAGG